MRVALLSSVASFIVDTADDEIDSGSHDVREGDTIGLSTTGNLPAALDDDAAGTIYFALNVGPDAFQLTYTPADEAITAVGFTVTVSTEVVSLTNHGFAEDDRVRLTTTNTLPAGLGLVLHYYVVNASQNTFQLSLTLGGAAVNITDTGTGTHTASTGTSIDITDTGTGLHSYQSGIALDGSSTPEVRRYVLTYVAKYGDVEQEGAPSLPSVDTVTHREGQRVILTSMPTGPGTGNFNIIKKNIYRVNTSDTTGEFQFVASVDLTQTEFIDDLLGIDLGEVIETEDYDMPPHNMQGLKPMANGMLIAFKGGSNEIIYAEPYRSHAWPVVYRRNTHYPIVGIGVYGMMALQPYSFGLVTTEQYPYTVRGNSPESMIMDQVELPYPCVSKESIVDMGRWGSMYASTDGLVLSSSQGIALKTRMQDGSWSITPTQWRARRPETIVAHRWDQYYLGFYTNSAGTSEGFIFDPATSDFVFIDDFASAIFLNNQTGVVHIFSNSKIQTWDTNTVFTAIWKDKMRWATASVAYTAARIHANSYASLTLVVDADGAEVVNQLVADQQVTRIDTGDLANLFELEVQTTDVVKTIEIATDIEGLLGE